MLSRKLTALAAGVLAVAASSAVANAAPVRGAPLAGVALMQSGAEEGVGGGMNTAAVIGVGFALIVGAVLVADSGGNDAPVSP